MSRPQKLNARATKIGDAVIRVVCISTLHDVPSYRVARNKALPGIRRPSHGGKRGEGRGELLHGSGIDHRGHLAGVVGGGRECSVGSGHGRIRGAQQWEIGEGEERRWWRPPSVDLVTSTDPSRRSMEVERR